MSDSENSWDKLLQIETAGRDDSGADEYHHPYEPTPYKVLERLLESGLMGKGDVLLDYGCGKGRVDFFLSHQGINTIGIEYDGRIYGSALHNRQTCLSKVKPEFVLSRGEAWEVPPEVNRCYFFNPFSAGILRKVMARILESYYAACREIFLFFYYPSDEYIAYLMTVEELDFYDEIECDDLFEADPRERILIFRLPGYGEEDYGNLCGCGS